MDAVSSAKMQCLMSGGQQRELGEISGDQSTPIGVESATKPLDTKLQPAQKL